MTLHTRLPHACDRKSAELARELGKPWPPVRHEPGKHERHANAARHFHQTADIIELPAMGSEALIGGPSL